MLPYEAGADLPAHQPNCFGCGPRNQAGLHLRCRATEAGVAGRFRLEEHHEGGPGVAHGGIVAAVLDDLLGFLLYRLGAPMVTARLEVDFRRPVPLAVEVDAEAEIVSRQGRKVWTRGVLRDAGGVYAEARGLFIRVRPEHFLRASRGARERIAHWAEWEDQGEAGPGPVGP